MPSKVPTSCQSKRKITMISYFSRHRLTTPLNVLRRTLPKALSLSLLVGTVLLTCLGITPEAYSATYYMAPNGTDSNFRGSSAKPWQKFTFAIPKLQPGDTLILKDGTYNYSTSGMPVINCSTSSAKNGTSAKPITIKAQHERRAFLDTRGWSAALYILNCSNWKIEGLRAKGGDSKSHKPQSLFYMYNSSNIAFKRLLLSHNNRYGNTQLIVLIKSKNILIEESEFYWFHRHAISLSGTNNSVVRRNYINSRGHRNISGGWKSSNSTRGQSGTVIYPGSNNIIENNISEGNQSGVSIQASGSASGNKLLGNISLKDHYGVYLQSRGSGSSKMPRNTTIENLVVVNPTWFGVFARGAKNTQLKNASSFGGYAGFVADVTNNWPGDGVYSFFSRNSLVNKPSRYGFVMMKQTEFSNKFPNSYNPKVDFYPKKNYFNERLQDPKLGNCKVFIPKTSSVKKKGQGGADIGANILYRYNKGKLTTQPLWNKTTGEFPHGAVVSGVNNKAGSSAFDVHKRLNVDTNGCKLPY